MKRLSAPRLLSALLTVVVTVLMTGCLGTAGPSKQELILGDWEASAQGQSFVLTYSASEVAIGSSGMSFHYEWVDNDHIRLDALGQSVITEVEFTNPDVMIQRSSQGTQTLRRAN